jgi:hypothetical protein
VISSPLKQFEALNFISFIFLAWKNPAPTQPKITGEKTYPDDEHHGKLLAQLHFSN